MVYGAIDLHMRYSQIRIIDAEGAWSGSGGCVTTAERAGGGVRGLGADAGVARDGDRE